MPSLHTYSRIKSICNYKINKALRLNRVMKQYSLSQLVYNTFSSPKRNKSMLIKPKPLAWEVSGCVMDTEGTPLVLVQA